MNPENINPHDHFFKQTFSDTKIASEFLQHFLPSSLADLFNTDKLEVINASYIDENLKEHLSDLLYRVELKKGGDAFVYVLMEHKSYPDKWVALQLLRYLLQIWVESKRKKIKKLPFIVPIVFYHGKSQWKISTKFSKLIDFNRETENLKYLLPEFEYHLFDLSKLLDENLVGYAPLVSALYLMREIFHKDLKEKFPEAFKLLEKGDLSEDEFYERVSAMGSYLLLSEKLDPESLQTGFAKNFGEKGKAYMNKVVGKWFNEGVVQGFSKGKNEGIAEGKAEGIAEGKLKIILNILRKKFGKISANNQQGLSELSDKQLDELSLLLFELNSLEDLADWLKNQLTTK